MDGLGTGGVHQRAVQDQLGWPEHVATNDH
jgi:hypothetical protein